MECKVRYFLTYNMQLALKYILMIFIIVHVNVMQTHHISLVFVKMPRRKRLRSQTKEAVANVYVCNNCKQTQGSLKWTADATVVSRTSIKRIQINLIVLITNSSRHSQFSFFIRKFFSVPQWFYSCLKLQQTILDYYFNNNNCNNRTFVHIIRTEILNYCITNGWLLNVKIVFC